MNWKSVGSALALLGGTICILAILHGITTPPPSPETKDRGIDPKLDLPRSASLSVPEKDWVEIAYVSGHDKVALQRIEALIARHALRVRIEGSVGQGILVPRSDAKRMKSLLLEEAKTAGFPIQFDDGTKYPPD